MGKNEARLNRIRRRLGELAPAEPLIVQIVWHDDATGEDELAGEVVLNGGQRPRPIQLRWPEDEDDEKRTRQDAPGRA